MPEIKDMCFTRFWRGVNDCLRVMGRPAATLGEAMGEWTAIRAAKRDEADPYGSVAAEQAYSHAMHTLSQRDVKEPMVLADLIAELERIEAEHKKALDEAYLRSQIHLEAFGWA